MLHIKRFLVLFMLLLVGGLIWYFSGVFEAKVDYNTQVKPIFNKKCISCHGGVKAKSDFSLLFREDALKPAKSGKYPIVPGKPGKSEMIQRVTQTDEEERMPYKHEPLTKEEISTLKTWIKQGAEWGEHWAYVPVKKPELPGIKNKWVKNEIDQYIYEKIEKEKLMPSPEADKQTLLRRVSLDLIGIPAEESVAKKYLNDDSEKAYGNLVDDLLASERFGEKWTTMWLDLARYADTKGFEKDGQRDIWEYRDWLIRAFNEDKPYNQFLIEQLAGDLLPDPTDAQYIATGFHRNTVANDEGGTDNEEYRTAAVLDRVNTTWTALMSTTFACVQCHSHPYDPVRHDEYYKFMAFFNNSRDVDSEEDYPLLRHYESEDSVEVLRIKEWLKQNGTADEAKKYYGLLKTWEPTTTSFERTDKYDNCELRDTKWLVIRKQSTFRMKQIDLSDKTYFLFRYRGYPNDGVWTIHLDSANGPVWTTINVPESKGEPRIFGIETKPVPGVHDLYFSYFSKKLEKIDFTALLLDWFYFGQPFPGKGKPGYDSTYSRYMRLLNKAVRTTPVMFESPADLVRETNVFERGNWLVKGDKVEPDVPKLFLQIEKQGRKNRMDLALWLTDKRHPLTARTMVNRLWEQIFGNGIVETLEDFGSQGIAPTHKELLDWMAWSFMNDCNWSMKKMIRTIVMSATYRQQSKVNDELLQKDPYNKLYARGPRVRLSAEQVRDQALFISGMLSKKMYGPGVMPYQPEGIWNSPYNGEQWKQSKGEDQYRRGLYTYWKRTAAYPSMTTFDATSRDVCAARRIRTNTPLQALVVLNDSAYIDMARNFAYRLKKDASSNVDGQIRRGYELATGHAISERDLLVLKELYGKALAKFNANEEKTCEMIGLTNEHNNAVTAALVVVCNAILNLDEVITKT
ncbi:MAG TPA: DUF1553 domain-containing protein [Chitinophagaceae bacterium]|nr:DUF1553 domain-containing protein [Chitinophagaceae bacterium]